MNRNVQQRSYFTRMHAVDHPLLKNHLLQLVVLDIDLTERCNNDCIHCYINRPETDLEASAREMSTAQIEAMIKEAAELGCVAVRFTGGEPLLRPDFEDIYMSARKSGLIVSLMTNATRIDENLARRLSAVPPLSPVEISFYGDSKKSYEKISRTAGAFEAACRGVDLLRKHRVPCLLKGILIHGPGDAHRRMAAWMARRFPGTDAVITWQVLSLRARRNEKMRNMEIQGIRMNPEILGRELAAAGSRKNILTPFCRPPHGKAGEALFRCGAGLEKVSVDARGRLQPCILLRHPDTAFHLDKGTLHEALTQWIPQVRSRRAEDPRYLERCAKCFLQGLCNQCPANAWLEHGKLDSPVAYFCDIAHATARRMGLVKAGEKSWTVKNWRERLERCNDAAGVEKQP
jgi:radical SAM protein with 4Fe4S-binding SPASM domain